MSTVWSQGDYRRVAERYVEIHDELVSRLEPSDGDRWLDVATGTGGVAVRAALAGANVTGLDITPTLLEHARKAARDAGVEIDLVEGNAERLPFPEGFFDVVSSSFGVVFAPDADAAAGELARVARPGARLGLTVWQPSQGLHHLYDPFLDEPPPVDSDQWGRRAELDRLLGSAFEFQLEPRTWVFENESLEAHWEWSSTAVPPLAALIRKLEPERRDELRRHFLDLNVVNVQPDGSVRDQREYFLVLGRRR